MSDIFELFAPEFLFTEINKYKRKILDKTGLEKNNFEFLLLLLQSHVAVISIKEFSCFLNEAEELMKNIDLKDAPSLHWLLS